MWRTGTISEFGSKLDTFADIVFVAVCLIKLLPIMHVPVWLYIWIAIISFIKVASIAVGFIRQREFISVHSMLNKMAGGLLFVFPLTLSFINLNYGGTIVCAVATFAAIQEGHTHTVTHSHDHNHYVTDGRHGHHHMGKDLESLPGAMHL